MFKKFFIFTLISSFSIAAFSNTEIYNCFKVNQSIPADKVLIQYDAQVDKGLIRMVSGKVTTPLDIIHAEQRYSEKYFFTNKSSSQYDVKIGFIVRSVSQNSFKGNTIYYSEGFKVLGKDTTALFSCLNK